MPEEMITISKKEYEGLLKAEDKLAALETGGVDNWSGYDDALVLFNSEFNEEQNS
jgi:hypothetical protein